MSNHILAQVHSALLSMFSALIVTLAALSALLFGGAVEGRLYPVVDNVELTRAVLASDTTTRIWGAFEKRRDCAFVRVEWWIGSPKSGSQVSVVFEEAAKDRNDGRQYFGPWLVRVPTDVFPFTTAIAVHRCHPFWETRTVFLQPQ